ncbi:hypothetical protein ACFSC3_08250 [Sphingomonas floccifaciens]|uniref:Uncharacterized protein n=1 Tax=Sphingomonas floccifaciens TaxID=1844115 RepID=A0ABW4NBQ9_9SPHN
MNIWLRVCIALTLTIASVAIEPRSDERAMYGFDGPLEQNWKPRELGGWPAPFVADDPATSVPHKLGIEDEFRPGAFVATLSFWLTAISIAEGAVCRSMEVRRRRKRRRSVGAQASS